MRGASPLSGRNRRWSEIVYDVSLPPELDQELQTVKSWLLRADPEGDRFAHVLRETYDQLYDGQRTGRYAWTQLHKTEKTHMGTLVEINLHREFDFDDGGEHTDYRIAGVEVDCKFSAGKNRWMLPIESIGHICLVVWANDEINSWTAGVVRVTRDRLADGLGNRDGKRALNQDGRDAIVTLWVGSLEENLLLHLLGETRDAILTARSSRGSQHGQARVNALFRHVQGRIVPRGTVATVAQQHDYMKRVRYDGGARSALRDDGVIILGHQVAHQNIARDLLLPVPAKGQLLAVRIVPANDEAGPSTLIAGAWWTRAGPDDPVIRAPTLAERSEA